MPEGEWIDFDSGNLLDAVGAGTEKVVNFGFMGSCYYWGAAGPCYAFYPAFKNFSIYEELARLRSSDRSAENGGDMGYLHRGMLSPAAQDVVDKLEIGELSEPVRLLRGVGIFKVSARKEARQRAFADVKHRARDLFVRDRSDQAWTSLKERLRSSTPVTFYSAAASTASN